MQFLLNIMNIFQKAEKKQKTRPKRTRFGLENKVLNYANSAKYLMVRTIWLV